MKSLTITVSCLFLLSCNTLSEQSKPINMKGEWISLSSVSINYPSLLISDSSAVFTSRGDTVYRFKYSIDPISRILWLTDPFNKKLSAKILKVDNDSLVFDRLWDLDTKQRFSRNKAK